MIGKKVIESKGLSLPIVGEMLKERKREGEELSYEQQQTLKYTQKYSKLTNAKAEKLMSDLQGIEGLTDEFRVKVIDVLPDNMDTLKLLVIKGKNVSQDKLDQILEIAKKYK